MECIDRVRPFGGYNRMKAAYHKLYFEWLNHSGRRSAIALLPLVNEQVRPCNVLDVGCGHGSWLVVWSELGVVDWLGLDGYHVDRNALLIPPGRFRAVDLSKPFSIGRRFDLVQSLEVAEHLPVDSAEEFVRCLCAHGDVVLFSAARPGQGGERHLNERPPSYWAGLFSAHGYAPFDCIRPYVIDNKAIAPWYRFNTVLYANAAGASRLGPLLGGKRVDRAVDLDRAGDFWWHLRCTALQLLPQSVVAFLLRLRYRQVVACSAKGRPTECPSGGVPLGGE
jgi:SAM-dependent methyltransferase